MRVSDIAPGSPAATIEAQFEANSLAASDAAHSDFFARVADGRLTLNPYLPANTQAGQFIDDVVRTSNLDLRSRLGLDAATVRINQRLVAYDGTYTIPDIYFPQSGNVLDYSMQLKTPNTRQVVGFLKASPDATVTIVPPSAVRPVYTIGAPR